MTQHSAELQKEHRSKAWRDNSGALHMQASREVNYSVLHTPRALFDAEEPTLAGVLQSAPILLVADAAVARIYAREWRHYAAERNLEILGELVLPISESLKSWDQVDAICSCAARCGMPRNGVMLGIGGGVILDTVGLAAAVFRRGIGYVRVPTTLVGMVDVAVGIKQAVNAYGKKNLIGAFYPPIASINDSHFLKTLPVSELTCGMAEIVKMALVRDRALFEVIEKHGRELVFSRFTSPIGLAREVLLQSELLMMQELAPNLFEHDRARLVDFGHTFSPAIEVWSAYRIPHGHAVAIDLLLSASIAVQRRIAGPHLFRRLFLLLKKLGLHVGASSVPDTATLVSALEEAKRHRGGALNLVTVQEPGRPLFLQDVDCDDVERARSALIGTSSFCERTSNLPATVAHECPAF